MGNFWGLLNTFWADYYLTFRMYFKHELLNFNFISLFSLSGTNPFKISYYTNNLYIETSTLTLITKNLQSNT